MAMTVGRVVGSVHRAPLTRDQRVDIGPGNVSRTGRGRSGAGPVSCVRPPQNGPSPGREDSCATESNRISARIVYR